MLSTWRLIVCALLLFMLSTWFLSQLKTNKDSQREYEKIPQTYLNDVTDIITNTDGTQKRQLYAKHVTQLIETDINELTTPLITIFRANKTPLLIRAKYGQMVDDDKISLFKDVVIEEEDADDTQPFILTTEQVVLHPDKGQAETDVEVVIRKQRTTSYATGMQANLSHNHINLLNNVKTIIKAKKQ